MQVAMGRTDLFSSSSSDVDLFFANEESYQATKASLRKSHGCKWMESSDGYDCATITKFDRSFTIQLIRFRFFPSMEALFNDFDFTVCKFVTSGRSVAAQHLSWSDLETRTLRMTGANRKTMFRVSKYARAGFTPAPGLIRRVIETGLNEDNYNPESMCVRSEDDY